MKVGQPADMPKVTPPAQAATGAAAPAKKEAAATATSTASSGGVAVTVSTAVRTLEQANRREAAADIDTDKVNAVRQAIEDGTYVVNPEAIADKLLSNAQEMLDRPRN